MSSKTDKFVLWFDELGNQDVPLVGGKSASLGEMTSKTKVPVPYGFATTALAYRYFMEQTGLDKKSAEILKELVDPEDTRTLQKVGRALRETIVKASMPKDLEREISDAYQELARRTKIKEPFVAVRS